LRRIDIIEQAQGVEHGQCSQVGPTPCFGCHSVTVIVAIIELHQIPLLLLLTHSQATLDRLPYAEESCP
jgi:hypothetical protein